MKDLAGISAGFFAGNRLIDPLRRLAAHEDERHESGGETGSIVAGASSGECPTHRGMWFAKMDRMRAQLWTIGHSTHTLEGFVVVLAHHEVGLVVDVRSVPRSRRHPHFAAAAMEHWLPEHGVDYRHLGGLGGWRHGQPNSPNAGWRCASFRGYADYALGFAFREALDELCALAVQLRTAVICSEALWWRCHRPLIADRLSACGWQVWHIASDGRTTAHRLSDFAVARRDGSVVYPVAHRPDRREMGP